MGKSTIIKAIEALYRYVDVSGLNENEKNVVKQLLDKIMKYYVGRYEEITKHASDTERVSKLSTLDCEITDYIVLIQNTIGGLNDVFTVANTIYKKTNYDEKKGSFRKKRLI